MQPADSYMVSWAEPVWSYDLSGEQITRRPIHYWKFWFSRSTAQEALSLASLKFG
jgi:hypothetical protein